MTFSGCLDREPLLTEQSNHQSSTRWANEFIGVTYGNMGEGQVIYRYRGTSKPGASVKGPPVLGVNLKCPPEVHVFTAHRATGSAGNL